MHARQEPPETRTEMATGRLESIQISNGGVPKRSVTSPVQVSEAGVAGDRQRDLRFHGGPDRAVCLLSQEIIDHFRAAGHPIDRGTTGENLTISGLDWLRVRTGAQLTVGPVVLEITKAAHPCKNIAASFSDGDFSRMSAKIHPGQSRMYARVLTPGVVRAGDPVTFTRLA